jgi:hypothetical protein
MLVECGFVRATASDGTEYTFTPSLGRIASLGAPHEIVQTFAALHGPNAEKEAAYVLACLCDQDDASALIGRPEASDSGVRYVGGSMPPVEQIIMAQHLMRHGIVGKAKPGKGDGKYSDKFEAAEYIAAARVHLGLSSPDAEGLSMTEFQMMFEMKFPDSGNKVRDVPTREEYQAAMRAIKERKRG